MKTRKPAAPLAAGFAAASQANARVLVLGSLPGVASIKAGEYFAHPRNAFWRIIEELFGISRSLQYPHRIEQLNAAGVALWDVLQASRRSGSLDSAIERDSAIPNDFTAFFAAHPRLELLAFNGKAAAELFHRQIGLDVAGLPAQRVTLPSTSPAYAAMSFDDKREAWRRIVLAN